MGDGTVERVVLVVDDLVVVLVGAPADVDVVVATLVDSGGVVVVDDVAPL